jgi:hypothetical protein
LIEANVPLTDNERSSGIHHLTGRACPQSGGPLRDSIIHFGEGLPAAALQEGARRSAGAPLNLVLGSSLLVGPANSLPFKGKGPVVIVTKSCTGEDLSALRSGGVLLRAGTDEFMESLVARCGLDLPNTSSTMASLAARVSARDEAVLRSDGDVPYDGGSDGGVFPDSLVRYLPPLVVRQSWEPVQRDGKSWHRWSLAVETADPTRSREVQSVHFRLHPTFSPSEYTLHKPPFSVGPFLGWGTFDVDVSVTHRLGHTSRAVFPLSFSKSETVWQLDFSEQAAQKAGA